MATSGVMDFWRRRKFVIAVGVLLICFILAFAHLGPFRRGRGREERKEKDGLHSLKLAKQGGKVGGGKKFRLSGSRKKPPPPLFNRNKFKKPMDQNRLNKIQMDRARNLNNPFKKAEAGKFPLPGRLNPHKDETPMDDTKGKEGDKHEDVKGEAPEIKDDHKDEYDDDDYDENGVLKKGGKLKSSINESVSTDGGKRNKTGRKPLPGSQLKDKLLRKLGGNQQQPGKFSGQQFNQPGNQPESGLSGNQRPSNQRFNRPGSQQFNQPQPGYTQGNQQFGNQQLNRPGQFNQPGSQQFNQPGQGNQRVGNQQPGYPQGNQRSGNQQPGYPQGNQRSGNQQPGYPQGNQRSGNQQPGYPQGNQRSGNQQPGYPQGNQRSGNQQPGYPQGNQRSGNQQPGYPQGNQRSGNQQPGYPQGNQRSGNQQPGYPKGNQRPGYPQGNQQFNRPGQFGDPQPGNPLPKNPQPVNPQPGNQQRGNQNKGPISQLGKPNPGKEGNPPMKADRGGGGGGLSQGLDNDDLPQPRSQRSTDQLYVRSSIPIGEPLVSKHTERQEAVVDAFRHAWRAYVDYAWGKDEVNPLSHTGTANYFDLGLTLVDSLDTMWLMGLTDEFRKAKDWVKTTMDIERNQHSVSLFETNIRVLGGLLSAFHLTGDGMFLDKAETLGNKLLPAFETPSGIPSTTVSLGNGAQKIAKSITVAEAGSLQVEFRDLSRATGNPAFRKASDRAMDVILSQSGGQQGMVTQMLNTRTGSFTNSLYTVGAGTDSYYEYVLKQWIQSGKVEDKFRDAYEKAVKGISKALVGHSEPSHITFLGTRFGLGSSPLTPYMDHLSCFYPGMLALGVMNDVAPSMKGLAENLTYTCYYMYNSTEETGLSPESFIFNADPGSRKDFKPAHEAQCILRPETVESLFYLYRLTKDRRYQEWGWQIFQAFEKHAKLEPSGYASLSDVHHPKSYRDRMESFFLSETLKYLFLLFGEDDNVISLNEWVFNTEAHPLPIWKNM